MKSISQICEPSTLPVSFGGESAAPMDQSPSEMKMRALAEKVCSDHGVKMITELELMDEMGMIELPLKVNGLQVKVTPVSPLAMANNMENVNEIMQFMQMSQALGPQGQMLLRMEAVGDYIADQLGIPAELRTTPQERQAMQQQMMQAAQAAMEAESAMQQPQEGEQ